MSPTLASLICILGIAVLFYLDRDGSTRLSNALWIPGIWIALLGSRPLSEWLGVTPSGNQQLDGSPIDAAVYAALMLCAFGILITRWQRARKLAFANWPILLYFLYCLLSTAWSCHPDVAFKRWTKSIGDVAIALVIATERNPLPAITRLASRLAALLFPTSILFIRYYGELGRRYTSDGNLMNTGVTTNKNSLGLIVTVLLLAVVCQVRSLYVRKELPDRRKRLLAQGILLAFGLALLWASDCATSKVCFLLGGLLIIVLNLRSIRCRPARVHALCLTTLLAAGVSLLFGMQGDVANALGRTSGMSGRTEIWAAVIPSTPNAIVGAGFETFWISPSAEAARDKLTGWSRVAEINEAHNGYIEAYLNLGLIGICLVAIMLVAGYRSAQRKFGVSPELGSLLLAYIAMAAVYGITEAGFRMLNPCWIFLLVGVVTANRGVDQDPIARFEPSQVSTRWMLHYVGDSTRASQDRPNATDLQSIHTSGLRR